MIGFICCWVVTKFTITRHHFSQFIADPLATVISFSIETYELKEDVVGCLLKIPQYLVREIAFTYLVIIVIASY